MKRSVLSPEAERDLDQIKAYLLEQGGVRVARYVLRKLREGISFVASSPGAGHLRTDLTDAAVRFWPYSPT